MLERYTRSAMRRLWSEREKFNRWLRVELALNQARVNLGRLPPQIHEAITRFAGFSVKRIEEIEEETNHDLLAFVQAVREKLERAGVGEYAGEFHTGAGATSYDIEDPALILALRKALQISEKTLEELEQALRTKAQEHKWTLIIASTHGQFAEPSTFGHLLMVYAEAVKRSCERIRRVIEFELSEGKMSGAVGIYTGPDPELEAEALRILGLRPAKAETQILQRDRHAAVMGTLSVAAGTIEQICGTFWVMMHSGIRELREPFGEKQKGSSAMPWKETTALTERLKGLARILRAYAQAATENISTMEYRDISQSSVERHIFGSGTALLNYMASKLTFVVENMTVFSDRMRQRLEVETHGVWAGQQIMMALVKSGVNPEAAYLYVQRLCFRAVEENKHIRSLLGTLPISEADSRIVFDVIPREQVDEFFDAVRYVTRGVEHIFGDF